MARRRKTKRERIPKIPVLPGGKALPGRPRKDRMPPIQRRATLTPAEKAKEDALLANQRFMGRIGHLAARGIPARLMAPLVNRDFPEAKTVPEDFEPLGRFFDACQVGRGEAILVVADALYSRAKEGTGKSFEAMFYLKCMAGWSETPAGRQKAKQEDETEEPITGIDITVTE